jgi:two-component system sensor histidine kinase BaeS
MRDRGIGALLVALIPHGLGGAAVHTVSVPAHVPGERNAEVGTAWRDCATSSLTRQLSPIVAPKALLYISQPAVTHQSLLDRIGLLRLATALGLVLLVVVAAGFVGSRRMLRPLDGLTAATRRMANGDLSARVPARGTDELAGLGRSFNEMASALSAAEAQRRRMVADVAHELRTPLANIRGYLEAGHEDVLPRDQAWTASLLEETSLLQHVVDDLQVLAEADAGRLSVTPDTDDVAGTVDLALKSIRAQADARDVRLVRRVSATATAPHDRLRMRQVVANLLSNAVRHAPPGSPVEVTVSGGDPVTITVRDAGPGIAPEHLAHVFERFYRADPSRSRETGGSGLGLAIVERLVRAHGGSVSAENTPDGGAAFTVSLPQEPTGSSPAH